MLTIKAHKPIEPVSLEIFGHVKNAAEALRIPYFVLGAKAIDLWLHNVYGLGSHRPTLDTDFSVAVESWQQFTELKNRLIAAGGFKHSRTVHRLTYNENVPIDLVPFGGIETPRGSVVWPPDNEQVMDVTGFQDINATAQEIQLAASGLTVRVATIPGLMLSKLFAWSDRRETKDAWDIGTLLHDYKDILNVARLHQDLDLLKSAGYDWGLVGSALLGLDVAALSSSETMKALRKLLQKDAEKDRLITRLATGIKWAGDEPLSAAEKLFNSFLSGLFKPR